MKRYASVVGAAAIMVLQFAAPPPVFAQGESAVPFLLIAPTSRASGMGETGTGWIDDGSAIYWNAGGLAFLDGYEVSLTHTNWLPQFQLPDLFYDYINYRMPVEAIDGVIAVSGTYLNLGEFTITNSSGPTPIGTFKSYEFAITAGYATKAFSDLGLGLNLRYIRSALSPVGTEKEGGNGIASAVSFDIGLMYRPEKLEVPLIGDIGNQFTAGFSLSNIGPKITYVDAAQADPLPTNLRLGIGYKIFSDEYNSLLAAIDASRIIVRRRDDGTSDPFYQAFWTCWGDGGLKKVIVSGGLEYWYGSPHLIALRIGYFYENPNYGGRKFLTFGAGIRYSLYGFDFSYISAGTDHPLSDTIRFSLLVNWGGAE
jgi:hypothetical protein